MRRAERLLAGLGLSAGLLLAPRPAAAVEGAPYLLSTEGVHAAGVAGAFGAEPGSPDAMWYNPGALTELNGVEASFARLSFPGAYDADHLALGLPLSWHHTLGLLYHRNAAQDTLRDALGAESGSFEVSQSVLGFSYSYRWHGVSVGATYKSVSEVLEKQSGSASMLDFGSLVELSKDSLVLGAAVQNIGSAPVLGSGGPAVDAPLLLRASANLRFNTDVARWQVLGDYRYTMVSARSGFALGLDYSEEYQDSRLGLRAGWDFSQSALGGAAGFAMGAAYGYGPVGIDYAFSPREALGNQHRIALTLLWDLRAKSTEKDLAGYLGPDLAAAPKGPTATPTPASQAYKPLAQGNVGASLDALLAATAVPTPVLSPTPVIETKKAKGGILGALSRLFNFGAAAPCESGDAGEKPAGVLQGVFKFLGFGSAPAEAPETPERANDDAFINDNKPAPTPQATPTAQPMQRLKGDSVALPPTPVPTPLADKVKAWMKF